MKQKRPLSEKCYILCGCLISLIFIQSIIIFLQANFMNQSRTFIDFIVLPIIISTIFLLIYGYKRILLPFSKIVKTMRMFNQGHTTEQIFQMEETLCSEMPAMMNRINTLLDKQTAIKMSKKQAEYLALQNQISPHFLYNTLEAIRGDALDAGMINIAETTEALATFFRYTITEVENLVTLEDELENVENYFIIQQYRFGDKLNMEIKTGDDISVLQCQIPKLTLQPIIENAVFHGLECKCGIGTIKIQIETTKQKLLVSIIDDGVGIDEELLDKMNERLNQVEMNYENDKKDMKHSGIALFNVSSRIKLLFGEEYGLHIYSNKNIGTNVRITLPYIVDDKR
jgi:two-component system, sensor histidine kinase YesM